MHLLGVVGIDRGVFFGLMGFIDLGDGMFGGVDWGLVSVFLWGVADG